MQVLDLVIRVQEVVVEVPEERRVPVSSGMKTAPETMTVLGKARNGSCNSPDILSHLCVTLSHNKHARGIKKTC